MPQNNGANANIQRARNVGAFTTFRYRGKSIAYLDNVVDQGQQPGVSPTVVQPLGSRNPVEIVTPRFITAGTLSLTITELWHQDVWEQLAGLAGTDDIVDIFNRLAGEPDYVTCTKIITPPNGRKYGKVYHQVTIVGIPDSDTISIQQLSVNKTIQALYTHATRL